MDFGLDVDFGLDLDFGLVFGLDLELWAGLGDEDKVEPTVSVTNQPRIGVWPAFRCTLRGSHHDPNPNSNPNPDLLFHFQRVKAICLAKQVQELGDVL